MGRPTGEGFGRTARAHVFEESDSGIVPMKPSNNDGSASAEKGEGRPLVTENTCEPRRPPTQSGLGLSPGQMGVRCVSVPPPVIRDKSRMR